MEFGLVPEDKKKKKKSGRGKRDGIGCFQGETGKGDSI